MIADIYGGLTFVTGFVYPLFAALCGSALGVLGALWVNGRGETSRRKYDLRTKLLLEVLPKLEPDRPAKLGPGIALPLAEAVMQGHKFDDHDVLLALIMASDIDGPNG